MVGQHVQPLADHRRQRDRHRCARRLFRQLRHPGCQPHPARANQPVGQFPRVQRIAARPGNELTEPPPGMPAHQIPHQLGDFPFWQLPEFYHAPAA